MPLTVEGFTAWGRWVTVIFPWPEESFVRIPRVRGSLFNATRRAYSYLGNLAGLPYLALSCAYSNLHL